MVPLCCTEFKNQKILEKNYVLQFLFFNSTTTHQPQKKMYPEIFGMKIYIPFEFLTVKKIFKGEGG